MSCSSEYSLKWDNYEATFVESIAKLYSNKKYCDATLVAANGKFFPVHKAILSISSSYFDELFLMATCKHPYIILHNIGDSMLEFLLKFMYKGEVEMPESKFYNFIKIANSLKIKSLMKKCFKESICNNSGDLDPVKIHSSVGIVGSHAGTFQLPNKNSFSKNPTVQPNRNIYQSFPPSGRHLPYPKVNKRTLDEDSDIEVLECKKSASNIASKGNPACLTLTDKGANISVLPLSKDQSKSKQLSSSPNAIIKMRTVFKHQGKSPKPPACNNKDRNIMVPGFRIASDSQNLSSIAHLNKNVPTLCTSTSAVPQQDESSEFEGFSSGKNSSLLFQCKVHGPEICNNPECLMMDLFEDPINPDRACPKISLAPKQGASLPIERLDVSQTLKDVRFPRLQCDHCSFSTDLKDSLISHMKSHAKSTSNKCAHCPFTAVSNACLQRHEIHHINDSDKRPLKCQFCSFRARDERSISNHEILHVGSEDTEEVLANECKKITRKKVIKRLKKATHARKKLIVKAKNATKINASNTDQISADKQINESESMM